MALYLVEETAPSDPPRRLVKAKSEASALKHVVSPRFKVTVITNPMDAADLAASGVRVEAAGEESEAEAA